MHNLQYLQEGLWPSQGEADTPQEVQPLGSDGKGSRQDTSQGWQTPNKTRVHHLTQGVTYNDAGRWPRFGTQQGECNVCKVRVPCWQCSMWIWDAVGDMRFCSISPKYTGYSAVFLSLMHSTLDNEFDLKLIQWFWWSLCYCVSISNIY